MKRIAERKTIVKAETNAIYRGRTLVVTLGTHEVQIRQKGTRRSYSVPWLAIYDLGAKLQARADREEKLKRKGGRV